MSRRRGKHRNANEPVSSNSLALVVGALAASVMCALPAAAQQKWEATVVTTSGAAVADRVAAPVAAARSMPNVSVPPSVFARTPNNSQRKAADQRVRDALLYEDLDDDVVAPIQDAEVDDASGDVAGLPHPPIPVGLKLREGWSPMVTGALGQGGNAGAVGDGSRQQSGAMRGAPASRPVPGTAARRVVAAQDPSASGAPAPQPTANGSIPAAASDNAQAPTGQDRSLASDGTAPAQPKPFEGLPPDATPVQQYCFNTTDTAADARFAWQAKKISEMEGELAKRVAVLEAKTEEYKTWLARRDEFSQRAQQTLVNFYKKMRPDAAALQLAAMEEETAAAVLTKLDTKIASSVMGEMDPTRAARIAAIISGAGKVKRSKIPPVAANPPADGPGPANGTQPAPDNRGKT